MERIYAPIDNKNLMEDGFEDDVFQDFYYAPNHRWNNIRHLVGSVKTENYDALVDVQWSFGSHSIDIQLLAYQPSENKDDVEQEVFDHYERVFKAWECEDNPDLVVKTRRINGILTVSFYFEYE